METLSEDGQPSPVSLCLPGKGTSKAAKARHKLAKLHSEAATGAEKQQLHKDDQRGMANILAGGPEVLEQRTSSLARLLWFPISLLLVLLGARWGSEMGAMRRIERLDAKLQHLQAQQEVAHCLPWEEDDSDGPPWQFNAQVQNHVAVPLLDLEQDSAHTPHHRAIGSSRSDEDLVPDGDSMPQSCSDSHFVAETAGKNRKIMQGPQAEHSGSGSNDYGTHEVITHIMWDTVQVSETRVERLDEGLSWNASLTALLPTMDAPRNQSWRLQWVKTHIRTSTKVELRHVVQSHVEHSQRESKGLWRLLWSQDVNLGSDEGEPEVPCAQKRTCVEAALSAHPCRTSSPSHSIFESSALAGIMHPSFGPRADTPFAHYMRTVSQVCAQAPHAYDTARFRSHHPGSAAWQLSWGNSSKSQRLTTCLFQNIEDAARRAAAQRPDGLWRLPWGNLTDLELSNEQIVAMQQSEVLQERADWQLVWFQSAHT